MMINEPPPPLAVTIESLLLVLRGNSKLVAAYNFLLIEAMC